VTFRARVVSLSLVAAETIALVSCGKRGGPTVAQYAAEARKLGDELDGARRVELAKIPPTVVPRPDLGPCPVQAFALDPNAPADIPAPSDTIMEDLFLVQSAGFAQANEVATKLGPRRKMLDVSLRLLEGKDDADDLESARKLAERGAWTHDLVLVIDELTLPEMVDGDTFQPGLLRGRGYVWDFGKGAIVCAAMVRVESSDTVKVQLAESQSAAKVGAEYLRGDLFQRGIHEAKKSLVVAGPRVP
jgi:hypothetical protein